MTELIPAINAATFDEVSSALTRLRPYAKVNGGPIEWVHLDIADGTFTPNSLWHNAKDLASIDIPFRVEVHLMVQDIDTRYTEWLMPNVDRLLIHLESGHDISLVLQNITAAKKEMGIAILPETPWEQTKPFWSAADTILFLAVSPGFPGQVMHKNTVDKIRGLHSACPHCIIEVDGGMNAKTAPSVLRAGAERIVSASAIFNTEDIGAALTTLQQSLNT